MVRSKVRSRRHGVRWPTARTPPVSGTCGKRAVQGPAERLVLTRHGVRACRRTPRTVVRPGPGHHRPRPAVGYARLRAGRHRPSIRSRSPLVDVVPRHRRVQRDALLLGEDPVAQPPRGPDLLLRGRDGGGTGTARSHPWQSNFLWSKPAWLGLAGGARVIDARTRCLPAVHPMNAQGHRAPPRVRRAVRPGPLRPAARDPPLDRAPPKERSARMPSSGRACRHPSDPQQKSENRGSPALAELANASRAQTGGLRFSAAVRARIFPNDLTRRVRGELRTFL